MTCSTKPVGSAASVLLLFTIACGEPAESTTPLEVTTSAAELIAVAGSSGVVHFDPNTMILSDQAGRRIQLQGEAQTAGLNIVDAVTVTDQNIQAFLSSPFPAPPDECSPENGANCAVERIAPPFAREDRDRRLEEVFKGRLRLRFNRTRRHPSRDSLMGIASGSASGTPSAVQMNVASWSSTPPCYDIAVGIYELTQHFNALKTSWIHYIIGKLVGAANGTAQSGTLPTLSGSINGMDVDMLVWNQDFLVTKTALDQLAYRYSANGCWSHTWGDRSSFAYNGFSPSGSGRWGFYMKMCEPVFIEIDFGDGTSWEGWGEECEYRFFPYQQLRADPASGSSGIMPERPTAHPLVRRSHVWA